MVHNCTVDAKCQFQRPRFTSSFTSLENLHMSTSPRKGSSNIEKSIFLNRLESSLIKSSYRGQLTRSWHIRLLRTIIGRNLSFSWRHGYSGRNIKNNLYVLGENKNDKHFSYDYWFTSCSFQSKEWIYQHRTYSAAKVLKQNRSSSHII